METERLSIERVDDQMDAVLSQLLDNQEEFATAGLKTIGPLNLLTLKLLVNSETILMIKDKRNYDLLGIIALMKVYDSPGNIIPHVWEIGYFLLPEKRHHGYMSEGVQTVCSAVQQKNSAYQIRAEVEKSNDSSIGVLERCQFEMVGMSEAGTQIWER